jgi:hypothetical protein
MRKAEPDSKKLGEFIWFAMEFLPDEFWLISIVIGVVFALIWFSGCRSLILWSL